MEIIGEFIFEIVLEGIFGLTVENPKAKTWVKTMIVSLLFGVLLALFGFLAYIGLKGSDWFLFGVGAILFLAFGALGVWLIPHRHKDNWKQDEES